MSTTPRAIRTDPGGQPRSEPGVMPVDREAWARELHLSNFVNSYYQFRDVSALGRCRTVLVVGPGQGLDTHVLKWRGYEVTTFDIDETFRPDHVGSVHDLRMFRDAQFDVVTASHVLEHLPLAYLDPALAEIARVGRFALVYLPVAGRHLQLRMQPGFLGLDWSLVLDLFNYFHRPSGDVPRYCQRQHYWEIGMRGFRVRDVAARLAPHFEVLRAYRNRDWNPSYNFVLRSRRHPADRDAAPDA
jgi:SAM-dependent methyltransferase